MRAKGKEERRTERGEREHRREDEGRGPTKGEGGLEMWRGDGGGLGG